MIGDILEGFNTMLTPMTIALAIAGVIAGSILGAIPGLTATMGIALILPVTFYLDPVSGIVMLIAMYKGGLFGGSVAAIMFRAPGTPAAAATVLDGNELKKRGYPRKAIRTALIASTTGDVLGNLVLIFSAAAIATFALQFGPAEYTMLILFALVLLTTVTQGSIAKSIISVLLGLMIGTINTDPVTSIPRLNFGIVELSGGISIIALVIGLLAVSEVFITIDDHFKNKFNKKKNSTDHQTEGLEEAVSKKDDNVTFKGIFGIKRTLFRSASIGTAIGALPGMGPVTSAFVSYGQAMKKSKNRKNFGKGEPEGIAAAEGGNSGTASANLIPTVSLGIPGDAEAAIIMGALIIHGITPGPQIFETNGPIVYGIFAGMLLASLISLILNWNLANMYRRISFIRPTVLAPIILVLSAAGTYGYSQATFDILVMFIFGLLGYILIKLKVPLVGIIIGFILGPRLEEYFRQFLVVADGNPLLFVTRPVSLVLLILIVLLITSTIYRTIKDNNKKQ
ncbi:tripartite tricarboxylate transporter permease [Salicibibacter kimchii]|uniref:DUF112 domain-containing protein n=1 Tax=Salicibibacter kimchii TaxID=2099786 RepID=A0A345BWQ1_9BACI|nr:tripartite tricarboxylate transporter permease [Salicibibacter kimchii]AXF55382.1 hypothetical protein DT065_04660 [Salicibibacter kimchii]